MDKRIYRVTVPGEKEVRHYYLQVGEDRRLTPLNDPRIHSASLLITELTEVELEELAKEDFNQ